MNNCYRFETIINNDNGFLDKSVDATYIIHLEGNGRLNNIRNQLQYFQPSKTVYILFNKGFKKCTKNLYTDSAPVDLIDAFLHVFQDAQKKRYENILVLEDDFFFNKQILDSNVSQNISDFLSNKKRENASFMYYLGCIPFLQAPYSGSHKRLILSCGTHACIYSKALRKSVLNTPVENISDWDIYHNLYTTRYAYNEPLCYQLFPDTDNSMEWSKNYFNMGQILPLLFKQFGLDKKVEPGYTVFYTFSLLQYYFWIFIIILIGIFIFYKL